MSDPMSTTESSTLTEQKVAAARPPVIFSLLGLALFLLLLVGHWRTIDSPSALFQLQAGNVIYNSREIPNRDIFSAGSRAGEWVFFEWLWASTVSAVYRSGEWINDRFTGTSMQLGEWHAVSALNVVLALLIYGLSIYRLRRRGAGWLESTAVLWVAGVALLPVFQPEAMMAVLPVFVLSLILTESRLRRPMVLLPFLAGLWANLHSSMLLILLAPFAHFLMPADEKRRRVYLAVIGAASLLGFLFTPNSVMIVPALAEIAGVQLAGIQERLTTELWEPAVLLRAGVAVLFVLPALAGRMFNRRDGLCAAVLAFAVVLLDVSALNFLLLYLAAPAAAGLTAMLATAWEGRQIRTLAGATLILGCVAFAAVGAFATKLSPQAWGAGVRAGVFPETAAGRLNALPLRAGVLNRPEDGGYLIWRLWPGWKVVADSRTQLYTPDFFDQYEDVWRGGQGWQAFFSLWRVHAVLGDVEIAARYPAHNLFYELADSEEWSAVYWDRKSILYLKSDVELTATNLTEFRRLKPGLPWAEMEKRLSTAQEWVELRADLRKALVDDPQNSLAAEFLKRANAAGR